ncbi:TspO/MBR family protein [Mycolicibacterium litorale]|uniref:Tryptophan-rich sensory protein n=1 Tax=Mycolicibacterium litorale TaxID=758802 RepID=A0AAD1II58_9MYCO|nr:TspO/MBR family protein [Mycolicibacterium litorale]MCV7414962.1 tryptophan-rich sensory protein [Mycolicibacterium litorale]TDY08211.1 TspO/MBR related protein [Mycolicibacterium litorale]BBY16135.1 tryptophan-rich sensory protein [Mycolicibacterium litorale]
MRASTLAKTAGTVFATGALGGLASRPGLSLWYATLKKPSFQPPSQAFGIVWPMLYADIAAVSAATIDHYNDSGQPAKAKAYQKALVANLILNGSWTWLFFNRHQLGLSAVAAGVLAASSADLTRRAVEAKGAQAAPLALYPLWCGFATALSSRIWWLNR